MRTMLKAGILMAGAIWFGAPTVSFAQGIGSGPLRAGAAKVAITPHPSELANPTDTIRDELFVRSIVVHDGTTCAVLVSIDAGSPRANVVDAAIPESAASTGCPEENYFISATHTHSGSTGGLGGAGAPTAETIAAAIVSSVDTALSSLEPARIGYGTAELDLNVNRDLFNSDLEWAQEPNPDGVSDKTLAVVAFIGDDGVPIGVFMNYAMHPINFYATGVISADFPGEASRYVEELFDNNTVALFSQGASGDQNPRLGYAAPFSTGWFRRGEAPTPLTVGPPADGNASQALAEAGSVTDAERMAAYQTVIERLGDYVTMLGHMVGSTAVRVMREDMRPAKRAAIWAGQETFACPGRIRRDADNPARENVFPGYDDAPDVEITVGLLRLGDIHLVTVNGEVYTNIALKLKRSAPANNTMMVTLVNGRSSAGYIYSDDAYPHLTFQVIGSRLKPGCAEGKILSTALDLMHQSGR